MASAPTPQSFIGSLALLVTQSRPQTGVLIEHGASTRCVQALEGYFSAWGSFTDCLLQIDLTLTQE